MRDGATHASSSVNLPPLYPWPSGACVYSRLFRSLVQVLSVVVPSSSATLVLYRWDQQRTTAHLHRVPTHTDGPWGRCNERRQDSIAPHATERNCWKRRAAER